ncbi:hypothetical protein D3C87_1568940 [compost metagenome]
MPMARRPQPHARLHGDAAFAQQRLGVAAPVRIAAGQARLPGQQQGVRPRVAQPDMHAVAPPRPQPRAGGEQGDHRLGRFTAVATLQAVIHRLRRRQQADMFSIDQNGLIIP